MRGFLLPSAIAAMFVLAWGVPAARADVTPTLGEVDQFAFNFCPSGWHVTGGAVLKVQSNRALAMVLGARYGGDGVKRFALPKAPGALSANGQRLTSCIAMIGVYPAGVTPAAR